MKRSFSVLRSVASSWLVLGITTITQMVQVPLALHYLDKKEFGLFALVSQFITTLMLVELGVTSALTRLFVDGLAQGRDAYNRIWSSGLCIFLIQASLITLGIIGISPFLSSIFNIPPELAHTAQWIFLGMGAFAVLRYVSNLFSMALIAGQRMASNNMALCMGVIVQFGVFIGALRAGLGLWAYLISNFSLLPVLALMNYRIARRHGLNGEFRLHHVNRRDLIQIFKLGMDVFVAGCFNLFITNSLLLFAGSLLSLEAAALLSVNLKLPMLLVSLYQRIPGSAGPALSERISQNDLERFRFAWKLLTKISLIVAVTGAGFYYLWSRLFVSLWTGPEMVVGASTTLLLALVPVRYVLHYSLVNSLAFFKELRLVRWPLLAEAGISALLLFILGRRYGLNGLLLANVGGVAIGSVWFGARAIARLGDIPMWQILGLVSQSMLIPGAFLAPLVYFYTPPATLAGTALLTVVSLVWLLITAANFLWTGLNTMERSYFRRLVLHMICRFCPSLATRQMPK